jgi:FkbM family methyltransferase
MLGGRPLSLVAREAVSPRNYRSLARMALGTPELASFARRYFLGGGDYPWSPRVRTPLGPVAPTLWSHHDVWTVNEIFFREDYRVDPDVRIVLDVGSNIGISGLYFLTRNRACRVYLHEPDPRNAVRLRDNLAAYGERWELAEAAVGPKSGEVEFAPDPTGRYGRVGAGAEAIRVPSIGINELLEGVLERHERIDLLKLDTEGLEEATVAAVRPELAERIEVIIFESERPAPLHGDRFRHSFANQTVRLEAHPR